MIMVFLYLQLKYTCTHNTMGKIWRLQIIKSFCILLGMLTVYEFAMNCSFDFLFEE